MIYDVVVVGLGPAGGTAAYDLARAGLRVLALEKEQIPRHKPCGGCISARADRLLPPAWREVIDQSIQQTSFSYRHRKGVVLTVDTPVAFMVRRDRFDYFLAEQARGAGATIVCGERLQQIRPDQVGLEIVSNRQTYRARCLIGADGVNGFTNRHVNGNRMRKAVAMGGEIKTAGTRLEEMQNLGHLDFGVIPHGYGWVFPKQGECSAGVVAFSSRYKHLADRWAAYLREDQRLSGLTPYRSYGYPMPLFDPSLLRLAAGPILLVGDAAGLVDPLFGEGIYFAIKSAHLASAVVREALQQSTPDYTIYEARVAQEIYSEILPSLYLARFIYRFTGLCYRFFLRHQWLAALYQQVMRGEAVGQSYYRLVQQAASGTLKGRVDHLLPSSHP